MAYTYYFKGTYYFRKIIHKKYLNRDKQLNYRRSLKLCMDKDFYYFLETNKSELDKLIDYININVTIKLKQGIFVDTTDINLYITELCENYKKLAGIENSDLEERRIKDLEYIDENGKLHEGFHLQALSVKLKEFTTLYSNGMRDINKIQKFGVEIIKRSNIEYHKVLEEIPSNKLTTFYEMLIKSEKELLMNDIKRYIQRNLFQFFQLIPNYTKNEDEKINQAFNEYINLIYDNPLNKNYLALIRTQTLATNIQQTSFNLDDPNVLNKIKESLLKDEKEKVLETSLDIDRLIEMYINFRDSSNTVNKRQKLSLGLFKEYLQGNGNEYKAKKIEELNEQDVEELGKLIAEATPRNEKHLINKTLFELVEYRKKTNDLRYSSNTLEMIDFDIKDFWKYISTKINKNLDSTLFSGFNSLYFSEKEKNKERRLDRQLRCFKKIELQKYIDIIYDEKNTKRILLSSPKNFYSFFFAFMYGLRIGEFSYIKMKDIRVQVTNGKRIYYIYLNEDTPPQSLKNQNAHRNIPITDLMIRLGFLNYVERRLKNNKKWLWDIPKSGYGTINTFHQRNIQKLFPNDADTKENRLKFFTDDNEEEDNSNSINVIQFRCLRKNFSEYIFTKKSGESYTNENAKRLMGHTEGTSSGRYLGRIEPFIAKDILDSIGTYGLEFDNLFSSVEKFYGKITTEISSLVDKDNWMKLSYVKLQEGRTLEV